MALTDAQRDALRAAVADALGPGAEIVSLRPLSAGASRLSWALDVRVGGIVRELVLQRERMPGRADIGTELRVLRAAAAAGVPVPEVVAADPAGVAVGGGYVIATRIPGETLPRRVLRSPELARARSGFAEVCGHILATIHRTPVAAVQPLDDGDPLEGLAGRLDALPVRRPAFEYALRRLDGERPPARPRTLVHGDFRLGNLVVAPEGVRAVLDWELAHLGNGVEDLGWLCARPWRFGMRRPVGGIGDLDRLLAAYRDSGGADVGREELRWWQLFASLRWGVFCLVQADVHLSGGFRSVELAVTGRLAAEMEYDLMRSLA